MNSVHELGPNGDSETIPSRKIRSKTKPGARAPSWPSWHAQARAWPAQVVVSWPGPGLVVVRDQSYRRRRAPYRGRLTRPCRRRWLRASPVVSWPWPSAVSRGPTPCRSPPQAVSWECARAMFTPSLPSCLATLQYFVLQPNSSQTKHLCHNCIAIQLPAHPAYYNTIFPAHCTLNLQYNNCIAIQF